MTMRYLAIAIRHVRKHSLHSGASLGGLAVGLACFLILSVYVTGELSFDRFHEKSDRIYRVGQHIPTSTDPQRATALFPHAELLVEEFLEIESAARIQRGGTHLVESPRLREYEDGLYYTEPSFFGIFDFQIITGQASDLSRPNTVFLTAEMSAKYFGAADPIGRMFTIDNEREMEVVGLVHAPPAASHIQFDFIASLATNAEVNAARPWNRLAFTYVLFSEPADIGAVEARLSSFSERHVAPHYDGEAAAAELIPLSRIHLFGGFSNDIEPQGDYRYVLLFSATAFLILLIACINYVSLATARSSERAREVGVRKSVGASRRNLIGQFFGEAVVFVSIAIVVALAIMFAFIPSIEGLLGRPLPILPSAPVLLSFLGTALFVMLVCGGYPALVLSRFTPSSILRGTIPSMRQPTIRRALLVFQFAVSVALIGCSLVINRQLEYVQEKRLGFDRENVLLIETHDSLGTQAQAFKRELLRHADVESASFAMSTPARPNVSGALGSSSVEGIQLPEGDRIISEWIYADYDYFDVLGLEIVEGRGHSEDIRPEESGIIINESARDAFGWTESLGREVLGARVSGVVRDFHMRSLRERIRPALIFLHPEASDLALVRLRSGWTSSTVERISGTWSDFVPSIPFDYSFLDQEFEAMYSADRRLGRIFLLFTTLAIALACLGLYGVSSFLVQQRTKEIGIRKVLGASPYSLFKLLSKEFVGLVVLAALIGGPIAYVGISRWLESFAYRVHVTVAIMTLAAGIALALAIIAVGSQTWKVIRANPTDSLRYE